MIKIYKYLKNKIQKYFKEFAKDSSLEQKFYFFALVFFLAYIFGLALDKLKILNYLAFDTIKLFSVVVPSITLFFVVFIFFVFANKKYKWFVIKPPPKWIENVFVIILVCLLVLIKQDKEYVYKSYWYFAEFFAILGFLRFLIMSQSETVKTIFTLTPIATIGVYYLIDNASQYIHDILFIDIGFGYTLLEASFLLAFSLLVSISSTLAIFVIIYIGYIMIHYSLAEDDFLWFKKFKKYQLETFFLRALIILIILVYINNKYHQDFTNKILIPNIKESVFSYEMYKKSLCENSLNKNQKIKQLTEKTALLATKIPSESKDSDEPSKSKNSDNAKSNITFERVPCIEIKTLKP